MAKVIEHSGLPRLTLDVEGSVVPTGLRVEGAQGGFNPHRRKAASYYLITAYEANTDQVLRVCKRAGNLQGGQASLAFLGELFVQLGATLARRPVLEMRMDGAFFQAAVIGVLETEGALHAIIAKHGHLIRCRPSAQSSCCTLGSSRSSRNAAPPDGPVHKEFGNP